MFVSIASLLLYSLAYDYELRLISPMLTPPAYANVLLCGAVVLGSLPLVSLASVIFPDPIRPVLLLLYVLFSAGVMANFRLVQVPWWNCIRRRTRGNLATPQRRIRRALIYSSSSAAPHSYTGRERLPVWLSSAGVLSLSLSYGFYLPVPAFPLVARAAAFAMISPASVFHGDGNDQTW
ncbi:hypothetical protein RHMOL_Rhmol03G0068200 [Rhododendron molle]|uniref:Uncharacterized protein n=1 Tax=Rhododendron molle TaxID=49168 RepID=A0ACC0PCG4_RHOML|nr:hypothetical protein RHMOL_Rhmol03G0068200 [Rhododendron molle]